MHLGIVEVFGVVRDEGLAPSDFSALTFLTGSMVVHLARGVVSMVISVAVGTGYWVIADGEALPSVLLVDVGFFALFAGDVVLAFVVSSSASAASDGAVGMNFVAKFPAAGALDKVDLLNPLGTVAGGVEEEDGFADKGLKVCLVWVRNTEADIAAGFSGNSISVGPCWSFDEHGVFKNIAQLSDLLLKLSVSDWDEFTREYPGVFIRYSFFVGDPFLGWNIVDDYSRPLG